MASDVPRSPSGAANKALPAERSEVDMLFHRLNNQLGIILANAELLEAKLKDANTSRAAQIMSSAVEAITVDKSIRERWQDT